MTTSQPHTLSLHDALPIFLGLAGLPTFGLGMATLAQTALMDPARQRRGWHDRVSHGIVVDLRPAPQLEEIVVERPHQIVNLTARRLAPVDTAPPVPPVPRPSPTPTPPPPPPAPPVQAGARWTVTFATGASMVVEGLGLVGRRPAGR